MDLVFSQAQVLPVPAQRVSSADSTAVLSSVEYDQDLLSDEAVVAALAGSKEYFDRLF